MPKVLEVCADSVESAVTAARSGATRIELCSALAAGGLSPDEDMYRMVRERVDIPVRRFAALGADGVVIGILREDGTLDAARMAGLIELAGGCGVTLHRAFDVCRDPLEALETARALGVDTILTSGQRAACTQGAALLRQLVQTARGKPQILIGAGVNAAVIRCLQPQTGADAFHLSAKHTVESGMRFRREGVPMGQPGLSEFAIVRCDGAAVRAARAALDALCPA